MTSWYIVKPYTMRAGDNRWSQQRVAFTTDDSDTCTMTNVTGGFCSIGHGENIAVYK